MDEKLWIDKPVILYGTGSKCIGMMVAFYRIYPKINIMYLTDSNPEKWGEDILGIKIIPPEQLPGIQEDYIVFIASMAENQILRYLLELGIDCNRIYLLWNTAIYKSKVYSIYDLYYLTHKSCLAASKYIKTLFYENNQYEYKPYKHEGYYKYAPNKPVSVGLIIYTKNSDKLSFSVPYYHNLKDEFLNINIYIADASDDGYYHKNAELIQGIDTSIRHFRFEPDTTIHHRRQAMLAHVEDEFVLYSPDDDVVYKYGLIRGLEILRDKGDIDAVTGMMYNYDENDFYNTTFLIENVNMNFKDDPIRNFMDWGKNIFYETHFSIFRKCKVENFYADISVLGYNAMMDIAFALLFPLYMNTENMDLPLNIKEFSWDSLGVKPSKCFLLGSLVMDGKLEEELNKLIQIICLKLQSHGFNTEEAGSLAVKKVKDILILLFGYDTGIEFFTLSNNQINYETAELGIMLSIETSIQRYSKADKNLIGVRV